ncbi:rap guanine nucleotide exchange factor 4-like isoform X2 [Limulus polyphemus]|uniref:Rap guanine nucleotide exchange factor 4-like isoform X2 n=1 Tax=Limulus polyphemus TaxID=6850 RepID=A0ABM1BGW2_LIMPO|nr:rap guanine nucleotide exchange factor 4-like isoform X2 [Limulus polyphemus]
MVTEWMSSMDKRPLDRTEEDVNAIYSRLRNVQAFQQFHPTLLHYLCYYGYYEDLDKGITLFREGDQGSNWYLVLAGSLEVHTSQSSRSQDSLTLCTLGIGTAFGDGVLNNSPHTATVITNEHCELLRIEQRDFQELWERNPHLMEDIVSPLNTVRSLTDLHRRGEKKDTNGTSRNLPPSNKHPEPSSPEARNPALPITQEPSAKLRRAGKVLRTMIFSHAPHLIRDRKYHMKTIRRCLVGTEMVDWLLQQAIGGAVRIHSRAQAIGMWQALLEEGVISHVSQEYQFKDKHLFYRFREDQDGVGTTPSQDDRHLAEKEFQESLTVLLQLSPEAILRTIIRKPPEDRTADDIEVIFEELLHIKALSHLSNSVKRELAGVLFFESHLRTGTVLFNQGDEGTSWYIILRGSVDVVIYGKGVVCTLHEGDDFGKLALVNDAPRAATIVTREDNCHFLRVDKIDFNRILRDAEANTVRLKEHGQDVLLLQKILTDVRGVEGSHCHYKYAVMAGTPQKMLEHLLETRIDIRVEDGTGPLTYSKDTFLEDFLLTHVIFMPSHQLCPELMKHYKVDSANSRHEKEFIVANKRRAVQFVHTWAIVVREAFFEDPIICSFLDDLQALLLKDFELYVGDLQMEVKLLAKMIDAKQRFQVDLASSASQRWKISNSGQLERLTSSGSAEEDEDEDRQPIKSTDEIIFRVYRADQTYTTLKTPTAATAETIKRSAADKLGLKDDVLLVEVRSTGEKVPFKDAEVSVPTGLSVNGKIFVCTADQIDSLRPLPEQEGPSEGTGDVLETFSSHDLAHQMSLYDWELFTVVHEYELTYQVFGRHQFRKSMSNLDVFLRRFNELQFWVVTELCLASSLSRRVQLLRKFIKVAAYCRDYQNLNAFFAIVMGLSNVAVSRMSQTWERLPGKLRKLYADFEALIDPSRNHRRYRIIVAKLAPPIIPFMPLLLKDMTFSHEGNKTYLEGLVNFEKMHMIAQTLRTLRYCRSQVLALEPPPISKVQQEVREYIRNIKVIDNQRRLTQLSNTLEPRRPC